MVDLNTLKSELRDIDREIAETKALIQSNNSDNLLKFTQTPGGAIGSLLDNAPHFERYAELRDLRERLLVTLAELDPKRAG